jgi:hypothetical protein
MINKIRNEFAIRKSFNNEKYMHKILQKLYRNKDDFSSFWSTNAEIIAYYEGHRAYISGLTAYIKGFQNDNVSFPVIGILDGRYTKIIKKAKNDDEDNTIIIYDQGSTEKFICNERTGLTFNEAPNGEVYQKENLYFNPLTYDCMDDKFKCILLFLFDIKIKLIHLFKIGYDNRNRYFVKDSITDLVTKKS